MYQTILEKFSQFAKALNAWFDSIFSSDGFLGSGNQYDFFGIAIDQNILLTFLFGSVGILLFLFLKVTSLKKKRRLRDEFEEALNEDDFDAFENFEFGKDNPLIIYPGNKAFQESARQSENYDAAFEDSEDEGPIPLFPDETRSNNSKIHTAKDSTQMDSASEEVQSEDSSDKEKLSVDIQQISFKPEDTDTIEPSSKTEGEGVDVSVTKEAQDEDRVLAQIEKEFEQIEKELNLISSRDKALGEESFPQFEDAPSEEIETSENIEEDLETEFKKTLPEDMIQTEIDDNVLTESPSNPATDDSDETEESHDAETSDPVEDEIQALESEMENTIHEISQHISSGDEDLFSIENPETSEDSIIEDNSFAGFKENESPGPDSELFPVEIHLEDFDLPEPDLELDDILTANDEDLELDEILNSVDEEQAPEISLGSDVLEEFDEPEAVPLHSVQDNGSTSHDLEGILRHLEKFQKDLDDRFGLLKQAGEESNHSIPSLFPDKRPKNISRPIRRYNFYKVLESLVFTKNQKKKIP